MIYEEDPDTAYKTEKLKQNVTGCPGGKTQFDREIGQFNLREFRSANYKQRASSQGVYLHSHSNQYGQPVTYNYCKKIYRTIEKNFPLKKRFPRDWIAKYSIEKNEGVCYDKWIGNIEYVNPKATSEDLTLAKRIAYCKAISLNTFDRK